MVTRYECYQFLAPKLTDELIVTSIGGVDGELHHLKDREGNLYHVTMSVATSVALGLAMALPHRKVLSFDGDGSMLMGLPVLTDIGYHQPSNLTVIVFDNESYEAPSRRCKTKLPSHTSVSANLAGIAREAGIKNSKLVSTLADFEQAFDEAVKVKGPNFIQVKVEWGNKPPGSNLDGPENSYRFIRHIERTEKIKLI